MSSVAEIETQNSMGSSLGTSNQRGMMMMLLLESIQALLKHYIMYNVHWSLQSGAVVLSVTSQVQMGPDSP